jgi:hypothetical protein
MIELNLGQIKLRVLDITNLPGALIRLTTHVPVNENDAAREMINTSDKLSTRVKRNRYIVGKIEIDGM